MFDLCKKSIIYLIALVHFWTCIVPLESRFLAIFRPRSRHTSTILPLEVWELPIHELRHCYGFKDFEVDFSVVAFNESSLKETFYLFEPTSPATVDEERLITAASRCVLSHGLYELWANADNIQSAVEICTHLSSCISKDDNFDVAAGVIGNPYITNDDLQRTVLSHFDPLFTSPRGASASVPLDNDKDNFKGLLNDNDKDVSPNLFEEGTTSQASCPPLRPYPCQGSVHIPIRIYLDGLTGRCIVGRLLTTGTAIHRYRPT